MRVLMLSWEYPPNNVGGLGKHVTELVPALDARDIDVSLLTPRLAGGEEVAQSGTDLTVYRVNPPDADMTDFFTFAMRGNVELEAKGASLFDEHGPFDLIHAHDWLAAFAGVALKQRYKTPLIATIHATERGRHRGYLSGEMQRAINNVEWWLSYEAWRVITCSHYMADEVESYFSLPADKIDIIPNGVDTSRFDALEGVDLSAFRARFAEPDEKILFYVGRIVPEKGLRPLIEAMPKVLATYPKVRLVIAGTGGQLEELRYASYSLGVQERVAFTGFISDANRDRLYKVADVAVFPSLYEPFGIVALEAMSAKTPVVSTGVGGLAEVVENHETGIVVHPDDPASLAWGILHTLMNPEWTQARVRNAYKMVTTQFNWGRIADETIDVYDHVVKERAKAKW